MHSNMSAKMCANMCRIVVYRPYRPPHDQEVAVKAWPKFSVPSLIHEELAVGTSPTCFSAFV